MIEIQGKIMKQKRLVMIQDISCFGKCSITVALPVISAMGIECAVIPTAVLSTHTGGFKNYTFRDLSDDIPKIAEHWKSLGLKFDAIYTGYLGSEKQIDMISSFFDEFRTDNTLVFVDPVMADNGKLYNGFNNDFPSGMAKLCSKADIIVPNLTEAVLMLGEKYPDNGYNEDFIRDTLKKLTGIGAKKAVITGVMSGPYKQGAVGYDSLSDTYCEYFRENIPESFHGTGDTFSSSMVGALTKDLPLEKAIKVAVDFTVGSIHETSGDPSSWYGVKFENCIPDLIKSIED
jgi:pyridoxine kinase